jgi:hypothetical protein
MAVVLEAIGEHRSRRWEAVSARARRSGHRRLVGVERRRLADDAARRDRAEIAPSRLSRTSGFMRKMSPSAMRRQPCQTGSGAAAPSRSSASPSGTASTVMALPVRQTADREAP